MNSTGRSSTEPNAAGEPGDASDAIAELFRVQFAPMVRLAALMSGSPQVAEELVMDAFERLAPRIGSVDHPAAYLRTSVVNAVRSHHRRLRTIRRQPGPAPTLPAHEPEIDELWERLADLRPDERACIVLRYYDDRAVADIAEELGMPVGTVKSHLHRGLSRLRHLLGEEDR